MIGCFDRPFLLAGACVRCVWMETGFTQCFCLRNFIAFIAFFLRTFLTQSIALRALRLDGNRAWADLHSSRRVTWTVCGRCSTRRDAGSLSAASERRPPMKTRWDAVVDVEPSSRARSWPELRPLCGLTAQTLRGTCSAVWRSASCPLYTVTQKTNYIKGKDKGT